jgi:hypothetical protein
MKKSPRILSILLLGLSLIPAMGFASDKDLEIIVQNPYAAILGEQPHDSSSHDKVERKKALDEIKLDNQTRAVLTELKLLKKKNPDYKTALLSLEKNYKSCGSSSGSPHLILNIRDLREDAKSFKLSFGSPDGCDMRLLSPYGEDGKKAFDMAVIRFMQSCAANLAGKAACPAQNVSTEVKPIIPVDTTSSLTTDMISSIANPAW